MVKGWRYFFYTLVVLAIGSIAWITVSYILTERLIKATGDPDLAVRQRAAHRVMARRKPIEFLEGQRQTVRDNVIWALESEVGKGDEKTVEWLTLLACDLSGALPVGEADTDTGRLAYQRLAVTPEHREAFTKQALERIEETTDATLKKERFAHRRAVAAWLLGITKATAGEAALVKALRDPYELVSQQAATALARLDLPDESPGSKALADYLSPLLRVLGGEYQCYVRLDSEGRIRNNRDRTGLIYGPFYVRVKSQGESSASDLARQRDSASYIQEQEQKRAAESAANLQSGRQGHVVRPVKGQTGLSIIPGSVVVSRQGRSVTDPVVNGPIDVVEGEMLTVQVGVQNEGPGDLVSDFYVSVYAGSPYPRNNVDRPKDGEFKGERAQDLRALTVPFEQRHSRALYHVDLPATPQDDRRDTVDLTLHFDSVESDRIQALGRLVNIGDASAVPALGEAINDSSHSVRQQAVTGLQRIAEAAHTTDVERREIARILRDHGLTSSDAVVRCAAAEGLGLARDPGSAGALMDVLVNEKDPTVRLVAARAVAGLPEAVRRSVLPRLISADPAMRLMAPRMLQGATDAPVAKQLLRAGDPALSREVLRTDSALLDQTDLRWAMGSSDVPTRALAVDELSVDDKDAVSLLLPMLSDKAGDVRAAAAAALGRALRSKVRPLPLPEYNKVVSALVDVVNGEAGDYIGVKAGEEPKDPDTAVVTDKATRAAAVTALVGVDSKDALRAVRDALQDTNADVLAAVLPAYKVSGQKLGDQRTRLSAIMSDTKMPGRVRQAAALAVWYAGMDLKPAAGAMPPPDPLADSSKPAAATESTDATVPADEPPTEQEVVDKTLDALVGLLNDPNDSVKTAGAVALLGLGDDRGKKVLRDQIRSKNLDVRREAARLVATLPEEKIASIRGLKKKDRDPVQILFNDLYSDGSLAVNFEFLCRAIGSLSDQPEVIEKLRAALNDPHPVLRSAGQVVLSQVNPNEALGHINAGLSDANEVVREHAVQAAERALVEAPEVLAILRGMVGDKRDPSLNVQHAASQALLVLGGD